MVRYNRMVSNPWHENSSQIHAMKFRENRKVKLTTIVWFFVASVGSEDHFGGGGGAAGSLNSVEK